MFDSSFTLEDHTYLDDEVLERGLVLGRVLIELALEAVHGEDFEGFEAGVALDHFLHAHFVVLASHHLPMLNLLVRHLVLVALLQLRHLLSVDALRLLLSVTLTQHLDLKRLFVSVLTHHALELEGISVQIHFNDIVLFN